MDTYIYDSASYYPADVNPSDVPADIMEYILGRWGDRPIHKLVIEADDPGLFDLNIFGTHQAKKQEWQEASVTSAFTINFSMSGYGKNGNYIGLATPPGEPYVLWVQFTGDRN